MADDDKYKWIVQRAFDEAVKQAVREVIAEHIGSALDSDIKSAIKEEAERMIASDKEIRDSIRNRLIHWIAKQ